MYKGEAAMADRQTVLHDLLSPIAEKCGVSLYDLEWVREGGERILRLYIDKPDGADLNDCERTSRAAEAVLDEEDIIPEAYALEVSSPGIERKLTRDAHFTRYIGHDIRLRLYAPVNGRKNFHGKLAAFQNGVLSIEVKNETDATLSFPREAVALCRLAVFDE
jgi:ribosome maturation factor RimP